MCKQAETVAVAPEVVDELEAKKQRKAAKRAAKEAAAAEAAAAEAEAPAEGEVDEAEAKKQRKAAKRAAKEAAAAEAQAAAEEEAPVAEKKAKKAKKAPAEEVAEEAEAEEVDEAEAKKQRKAAKKAAKEAVAAAVAEEAEAPKKSNKEKRAAEEAEEEAPKKKSKKEDAADAKAEEPKDEEDKNALKVFVRGLPWSVEESVLRNDFTECGEIVDLRMPMNDEGKPKGIAFIKYATQEGFDAALKFDNTDYGGRTIFVSKAGEGGKGKDGKGKGKDGKGKDGKGKDGKGERNNELTVFVRGLPFSVEEAALNKDFTECGEIEHLKLPLNEEGKPKGIAFIKFKTQEGMDAALKFDNTDYGGRTINVSKAGEGGKGKDGKGKGKDGKGKDGKGKGKKGKGKAPSEAKAKSSGCIVAGEGEKKTFDDSDDE